MKKFFFIALFAIGLVTTTQAQSLNSNDDFYISPYATNGFQADLDYDDPNINNGNILYFSYYSTSSNDVTITVNGASYSVDGVDFGSIAYGDATGPLGTFSYEFYRDSSGYISYVEICLY
ncbi:MAG: hypothetical protein ABJK28_08465 [Algibacter sp.]